LESDGDVRLAKNTSGYDLIDELLNDCCYKKIFADKFEGITQPNFT
jgi:hypothetical protein